ncbi:signal peptidase II [Candidatus Woesearchaeota archaeon]|nr:signal peptidase II [Candidatus Woesearchaeota archaeon]
MVKKLYLIALLVFLIDRIFKIIFIENEFFIFKFSLNTGAAFGLLKNFNTFLIFFGIIVIGIILYHRNEKKLQVGMGFLLGGVVSNVLDRIFYHGVIDYIHLDFINNVFNLADVANVIGALILACHFWKE